MTLLQVQQYRQLVQQLSGEINGLRSLQQHMAARLERLIYSLQQDLIEQ